MITRPALALVALSIIAGCGDKKTIPARGDHPGPERLLEGGSLVFEDTFERAALGPNWTTEHDGWAIVDGWAHSKRPFNKGLWLKTQLPPTARVRIEFDARSEPRNDGKPFPGDLKCEAFADTPTHEAGFVFINGGWGNRLDVLADRDEHAKDRPQTDAKPVQPSKVHRYAVVRDGAKLYWFRDGQLLLSHQSSRPIEGRYFGFNNWETHAYFDNLRVFELGPDDA